MKNFKEVKFSGPAYYTISVQGKLNPKLFDSFEEMKIIEDKTIDDISITTIAGRIKDQTQLSGIINTIYDLGFPILLVECDGSILREY